MHRHPSPIEPIRPAPTVWRTGRALLAAQLISGALGAAAWFVAARSHPAAAVGTALALVGGVMWAGLVGNLGLGSLLVSVLPAATRLERARLAALAVALATGAGLGLGLAIGAVLALGGTDLADACRNPVVLAALGLGGAAWAAGVVLDHAAVALAKAELALVRGAVSGITRLVLLAAAVAFGSTNAAALVAGWSLAAVAGVVVVTVTLRSCGDLTWDSHLSAVAAGPLARRAVRTHYGINVAGQTPPMALPIVLAAVGASVQAAAFGAAWQLAATVGLVSPAIATGLFAAGAADRAGAPRLARSAGRRTLAAVAVGSLILVVVGPWVLGIVGPTYRAQGTTALIVLAVALLVDAVTNIEVASLRVERRYRRATVVNGAIALVAIVGTVAAGPAWGATGAAIAWLAGQVVGAAVATNPLLLLTSPRSDPHEDLARLRVAPAQPRERGRPLDRPAGHGPAGDRARGRGAPRHTRRSAHGPGVRYGPWPARPSTTPGGDLAS